MLQPKYKIARRNRAVTASGLNRLPMNMLNPNATQPTRAQMPPRRVLVLEPDRLIRALIIEWLVLAGNEALGATDLTDAGAMPAQGYELVLMDIPAPHRAARQAVMHLKKAIPGTPVIAMSADVTASGNVACDALARELGASAVLVKPFSRHALLCAVQRVRT